MSRARRAGLSARCGRTGPVACDLPGEVPVQAGLVAEADGAGDVLTAAHGRAVGRGMPMAVFTADLFATAHDEANRAAVAAVGGAARGRCRGRGRRPPSPAGTRDVPPCFWLHRATI